MPRSGRSPRSPFRRSEELDGDAFRFDGFHVFSQRGHLRPGAPVDDGDALRAETTGRPGAIDRRVAAADYRDPLARAPPSRQG